MLTDKNRRFLRFKNKRCVYMEVLDYFTRELGEHSIIHIENYNGR